MDVILIAFDDERHYQRQEQGHVDESPHDGWLGCGSMTEKGVHSGVIRVGGIPMRVIPQVVRVERVGHGLG